VANFLAVTPQMESKSYREVRRSYYAQFPAFWATLPGAEQEEYAVFGALEITSEQVRELRTAAARLYQLLQRQASLLQRADKGALLDVGIPPCAVPYCQTIMPGMPAIMCGRFEFALTEQGPKLLELNAETPTFVVELFQMNSQFCTDFGLSDPNRQARMQLARAVQAAIQAGIAWLKPRPWRRASVVFSAYADNKEEYNTAEFYRQLANLTQCFTYRTAFCHLEDLRVTDDGLWTADDRPIDVLYKMYPTEYLIEDCAPDGTPVGLMLLDLVRKRRLAVLNPPSAFVLQSKALMALLWTAHLARSNLFTDEEHAWLERYLLPTYFTAHDLQAAPGFTGSYVAKPVYGREGVSITIHQGSEILEKSPDTLYDDQLMIYQQFVPLPKATILTEMGPTEVNLVHNCFVVAGESSAIGIRGASKLILDDNSYFIPVCYPQQPR
jgi:glutathionylspermidine synthase